MRVRKLDALHIAITAIQNREDADHGAGGFAESRPTAVSEAARRSVQPERARPNGGDAVRDRIGANAEHRLVSEPSSRSVRPSEVGTRSVRPVTDERDELAAFGRQPDAQRQTRELELAIEHEESDVVRADGIRQRG